MGGLRDRPSNRRSGDARDRDRDRPAVTAGRTAESGVGAHGTWVSLEAALPKNFHCRGNCRRVSPPGVGRHRESSRQAGHSAPPFSVLRRRLAPRPRLTMPDSFWCGFQARVVVFIKRMAFKWKPYRPGAQSLKCKTHGFRIIKMRF